MIKKIYYIENKLKLKQVVVVVVVVVGVVFY